MDVLEEILDSNEDTDKVHHGCYCLGTLLDFLGLTWLSDSILSRLSGLWSLLVSLPSVDPRSLLLRFLYLPLRLSYSDVPSLHQLHCVLVVSNQRQLTPIFGTTHHGVTQPDSSSASFR